MNDGFRATPEASGTAWGGCPGLALVPQPPAGPGCLWLQPGRLRLPGWPGRLARSARRLLRTQLLGRSVFHYTYSLSRRMEGHAAGWRWGKGQAGRAGGRGAGWRAGGGHSPGCRTAFGTGSAWRPRLRTSSIRPCQRRSDTRGTAGRRCRRGLRGRKRRGVRPGHRGPHRTARAPSARGSLRGGRGVRHPGKTNRGGPGPSGTGRWGKCARHRHRRRPASLSQHLPGQSERAAPSRPPSVTLGRVCRAWGCLRSPLKTWERVQGEGRTPPCQHEESSRE